MSDPPQAQPKLSLTSMTIDGRYTVTRVLGRSDRALTVEALRDDIGQRVVVKLLRNYSDDPEVATRFKREIRAAASVQHPNVLTVFDAGATSDGRPYYAMEHIEGRRLRALCEGEAPVEAGRVLHMLRQIAAGVSAAHAAGIFHRDLSPDSIFVSARNGRSDFITVGDFAVAKILSSNASVKLTVAGALVGTSDYMPPEKADPGFVAPTGLLADAAADVYAIGCIGFELLTGRLPLTDSSIMTQFAKRSNEAPDWPADVAVPAALRDAVDQMLSADVTQRPGSGFEALRLLDRIDAKTLERQDPRQRPRQKSHSRSAVVTPRRPSPPSPQPVANRVPTRTPGPKRTIGRGMMERHNGFTALLLVREAQERGIFVSAFVDADTMRPGADVAFEFPAPNAAGGTVILKGTVRGQPEATPRSVDAYVELDAESVATVYPHLRRRWASKATRP